MGQPGHTLNLALSERLPAFHDFCKTLQAGGNHGAITMARAGPGTGEIEFFGLIFSPYCVNKYIFFLEFVSA